jgi:hypothetical protein
VKSTDSVAEDYTNKEEAPVTATMNMDTTPPPPLLTVGAEAEAGVAVIPVTITVTVLAPAENDRDLLRSITDREGYVHTRIPWSKLSVHYASCATVYCTWR